MYLVAPDILADACGLSLGLILLAVPVGLVLWLLGWWSHRFWVVLLTTVVAGVSGLHIAPAFQAPALVGALLLALAAGVLALALIRLVAFAAGGLAGLLLVQAVYPSLSQPLVTFLVAGLLSLLLFRPCMMALTSLAGAVLLTFAALMLLNYYAVLDAPAWCEQSTVLLNWLAGSLAFVGMVVQFLLDRYVFRKKTSKGKGWLAELWAMLPSRSSTGSGSGRIPTARRAA
jgi:hypothetical protein